MRLLAPLSVRALKLVAVGAVAAVALAACGGTTTSSSSTGGAATGTGSAVSSGTTGSGTQPPAEAFLATLGAPKQIGSTVPANGDVNPYGIAVVPSSTGALVANDILVSNFNDKPNIQGTGHTLVELSPAGKLTQFATISPTDRNLTCPGGVGLSTALAILPGGYVVVGSVPDGPGGTLPAPNPAGCLIVLNSSGKVIESWSGTELNGPWDMTSTVDGSDATLYVSDVLSRKSMAQGAVKSGMCEEVRISVSLPAGGVPRMTGSTVIATGLPWKSNKTAFVLGPTGAAIGPNGTLYVAETLTNQIDAIPEAATRTTAVKNGASTTLTSGGDLDAPLGLLAVPNGDVVAVNGNDGNAVEVSPSGMQVKMLTLVHNGAGDLFGITLAPGGHALYFVNDGANAVDEASVKPS